MKLKKQESIALALPIDATPLHYITAAKVKLGGVSDEVLGGRFACSKQFISKARRGNMSDSLAVKLEQLLGVEPGEILLVARAARETNRVFKERLLSYTGKALRLVSSKAANVVAAFAVSLAALLNPQPAEAVGGVGRFRP